MRRRHIREEDITKLEWCLIVVIMLIMTIVGIMIFNGMRRAENAKIEFYNNSVKCTTYDAVSHGHKTAVGSAIIWADITTSKPVVNPFELTGEFMYIERYVERYNQHTRVVTTTVNGKTRRRTETYCSWDYYSSEYDESPTVKFNDIEVLTGLVSLPKPYSVKLSSENITLPDGFSFDGDYYITDRFGFTSVGDYRISYLYRPISYPKSSIMVNFSVDGMKPIESSIFEPMIGATPDEFVESKTSSIGVGKYLVFILIMIVSGGLSFLLVTNIDLRFESES